MLKDDLYTIANLESTDSTLSAKIIINANHRIFEGHFPGQPVLPGVCSVEIMEELISEVKGKRYTLKEANNMKFLSLVDPTQANTLCFDIQFVEENEFLKVNVSARLDDETSTFKMKGVLA